MGFNRVQSDHGLYIYLRDDVRLLMPVFVDDITLACKDGAKIDSVIQELSQHFKLRDLGPTTQLLGIEIHRDRPNRQLSISQSQFISNLIQEHGLSNSKPVTTPLNPGTRLSLPTVLSSFSSHSGHQEQVRLALERQHRCLHHS